MLKPRITNGRNGSDVRCNFILTPRTKMSKSMDGHCMLPFSFFDRSPSAWITISFVEDALNCVVRLGTQRLRDGWGKSRTRLFSLMEKKLTRTRSKDNNHQHHRSRRRRHHSATPSPPRLVFSTYFESDASLSLAFSSSFLLFSRTHASTHCGHGKKNERRPWTICQRLSACLAQRTRHQQCKTMLLLLSSALPLCVIGRRHARSSANQPVLNKLRKRTREY